MSIVNSPLLKIFLDIKGSIRGFLDLFDKVKFPIKKDSALETSHVNDPPNFSIFLFTKDVFRRDGGRSKIS
jgi:hypothetical protein